MNELTPERVRAVLGDSPLITPGMVVDLTASANADSEEGVEWLPYHKLALSVLSQAFGVMEAVALHGIKLAAASSDVAANRFAAHREQFDYARWLFRLHLRPCGIGPDESPERAAQVDALIADQMGD